MILQSIINKYLSLDPDIEQLLLPLQNKCIAVNCEDFPGQPLYCTFSAKNLLFTSSIPNHIDVNISSNLSGFVAFALFQDNAAIHISGNIHLAESLQKLLQDLNVDWEEELSKYSGDIIAHQAIKHLKKMRLYQRVSHESLTNMISEYLQEESGLLPTNHEVQQFMHEVDELRFSVDRLNARVVSYENN